MMGQPWNEQLRSHGVLWRGIMWRKQTDRDKE